MFSEFDLLAREFATGAIAEQFAARDAVGVKLPVLYHPPHGEPVPVTVIDTGDVRIEQDELLAGRGFEETRHVEKLTLRVGPGPDYQRQGKIEIGGGEPASAGGRQGLWQIDQLTGLGTALVELQLTRVRKQATGRAGRNQKKN